MLFDILELSQAEVDALRSSPRWPNLLARAHTGPRECRAFAPNRADTSVRFDVLPFRALADDEIDALNKAGQRHARFLGLDADVRVGRP